MNYNEALNYIISKAEPRHYAGALIVLSSCLKKWATLRKITALFILQEQTERVPLPLHDCKIL